MYKLIIVDDEKWVRMGLKNTIDWEKYEIEIVGEAEDGNQALEIIKKEKPDIIITDIYMDEMDGLELLNRCDDIIPYSQVIILSGYEEFELAQTAIRNKAFDYLLKPVRAEDLIKIIKKAKNQINEDYLHLEHEKKLEKLQQSLPVLKERYLNFLLIKRITLDEIIENYSFLNLNFNKQNFVVVIISVNDMDYSNDKKVIQITKMEIKEEIDKIINDSFKGEVLEDYPHNFIVIINYDNDLTKINLMDKLNKVAKQIQRIILNKFNLNITIGIGKLYKEPEFIADSYQEAKEALEYNIFVDNNIIFSDDINNSNHNYAFSYPYNLENNIIRSIKTGDTDEIKIYCQNFIDFFKENNNLSPYDLKRGSLQLIYTVLKKLVEWNVSPDKLFEEENFEVKIRSTKSLTKLTKLLSDFIITIAQEMKERKEDKNKLHVNKAKEFIQKNYNHDISLNSIAEHVYLTPNYLSKIFKDKVGKTVISYLIEIRIEKAKELLKNTNLKVYEIAGKVGYSNSRYFGQLFKKQVGFTPNEYRG